MAKPLSFPAFLMLVAVSSGATGAAHAAGCADDFAGPDLDAAWTFLDADGEAGGSARIAGGKLELAGKGSDAYQNINEFVGVRRADLAGDFDVSVKIESQSNTHAWAQAGILAATDATAPAKGGYVIADVTPGNGFHLFYDGAGTQGTLDAHADAGVSAYPVWIRLARAGGKFSAWYKTALGADWTSIAKDIAAQGTTGASQIALVSLSHNDAMEAKTVFDDFTCAGSATGISKTGMLPWTRLSSTWTGGYRFDAAGRFQAANTVFTFTNSRMPKWESSRP